MSFFFLYSVVFPEVFDRGSKLNSLIVLQDPESLKGSTKEMSDRTENLLLKLSYL